MKKFLVLYKASGPDFERAMKSSPAEQQAGMEAWNAWGQKAAAAIIDMGAPLGKTLLVTAKGASPARNDLGGYSILQGESKEQVGELLKGHPHFLTGESATIEVVELLPMPGM
jgi:hypothetical protein